MIRSVVFGIAFAAIIAILPCRAALVRRLRDRYPEIYANVGRPSALGRFDHFVSRLPSQSGYDLVDRGTKGLVQIIRILTLVYAVGGAVFLLSLTKLIFP